MTLQALTLIVAPQMVHLASIHAKAILRQLRGWSFVSLRITDHPDETSIRHFHMLVSGQFPLGRPPCKSLSRGSNGLPGALARAPDTV